MGDTPRVVGALHQTNLLAKIGCRGEGHNQNNQRRGGGKGGGGGGGEIRMQERDDGPGRRRRTVSRRPWIWVSRARAFPSCLCVVFLFFFSPSLRLFRSSLPPFVLSVLLSPPSLGIWTGTALPSSCLCSLISPLTFASPPQSLQLQPPKAPPPLGASCRVQYNTGDS